MERYRNRRQGWHVKHYTAWYKCEGSPCSTTWAKNTLQQAGVVKKAHQCGVHRKRRKRAPWPGMMLHQFCLLQARRHTEQLAWGTGGGRAPGPVLLVVHRPRAPLLAHARGGREGRPDQSDTVWPSDGPACSRQGSWASRGFPRIRLKPEGAQSEPFAPIKIAWSEHWKSRV